ncbi:maoC like domain protein [Sphingomonas sp. S17]|jgi:acyl dehydratase|uniref:MaoC family dehydratase n=2 Tax=Sphingomonas paucimobilis TaxID=13689 RepID=A0A411LM79_SPHPI|nr:MULTISPECIES: MaoC family dehydratase [Sphingomonas]MCH7863035.1 MaoC family dehydratase [Pseudomonadota bacterium]EGI53354.1 maoC like domain protein [Sphingomonas sp. S17]MBQ1479311.1 MaoC family dehydratase [Sphingomonas sp.]MCM3679922.1 MaoC family dehydratase [Sphingomonas paucimobilis]MDG5970683.1 MaoC family dehydratase [Sphingomonas paucimobilis]
MVFLEDVAVGDKARFGECHVDRDEVIAFASRYDPQPFHLSDEAAAATHFGRLSASGWHTASMTMAMIVAYYRETGFQSLGSPGVDELRWLKPVYPGDTLRCETEVLETRRSASRPEMGFVISQLTVFNQDDVAVMRFRPTLLVRTRPTG